MSKKVLVILSSLAVLFLVSAWKVSCLFTARFFGATSVDSYSASWIWFPVAVISFIFLFGIPDFLEFLEEKKTKKTIH